MEWVEEGLKKSKQQQPYKWKENQEIEKVFKKRRKLSSDKFHSKMESEPKHVPWDLGSFWQG